MSFRSTVNCWFILASLVALCSTSPNIVHERRSISEARHFRPSDLAARQQTPLFANIESLSIEERIQRAKHSAKVKYYTFDDWWLGDTANITFPAEEFISLTHFALVNAQTAHEKGFLHANDTNCAASIPNSLHSYPTNFTTPSVVRSNATALAEAGLSEFFDFIAFTSKPLGPAPQYTAIGLNVWRVEIDGDERNATLIDSMFSLHLDDLKFFPANTMIPSEYWPGWGEGVNWLEFESRTEEGEGWNFCLDNLVLLFHGKE